MSEERKLATVERIAAVVPIPDADAIEAVQVRGWTVVTRKGEFRPGDWCVYFEIDSMLPLSDSRFAFLGARGRKVVDGAEVHVLRTAKLRGVYSQGLALPIDDFPEILGWLDGVDVTSELGIAKYEPPIPAGLSGAVVGPFPTQFCQKTDAERVQNLADAFEELRHHEWFATEKVDGTSVTYINDDGRLRVCGRNWEYAPSDGAMWRLAESCDVLAALEPGMAVQCELFGEGVQGNPLRIKGQRLAAFNVIRDRRPVPFGEWPAAVQAFAVPRLDLELPQSVAEAVAQADGIESSIAPGHKAEGIVWHSANGMTYPELGNRSCFKVISNAWLAKQAKRGD